VRWFGSRPEAPPGCSPNLKKEMVMKRQADERLKALEARVSFLEERLAAFANGDISLEQLLKTENEARTLS
jgi:hypothetical protein